MNDRVMGESAEVPSVRKVHKVPHGITPAAKKGLAAPSLDKRTARERVLYGQGVYFTDQPPKSIALLGHCNRCCPSSTPLATALTSRCRTQPEDERWALACDNLASGTRRRPRTHPKTRALTPLPPLIKFPVVELGSWLD